jgi:hypothetical protein
MLLRCRSRMPASFSTARSRRSAALETKDVKSDTWSFAPPAHHNLESYLHEYIVGVSELKKFWRLMPPCWWTVFPDTPS